MERQKTSGSILKHFLSCRWQLPYIWGHDSPRKWNQSRWLIKWQLTQLRPRQSFKSTQWRELRLLRFNSRENSFRWMLFRNFIEEREKTVRKCFEWIAAVTWLLLHLFGLRELTDSLELILSWRLVSDLLHLVPAGETRASSGVLRSRCLSALQELVGRNGLLSLLLSTV